MIRTAISGAGGRMGRTLVQKVIASKGLRLGAAFEHAGHSELGQDAGILAGAGASEVPLTDAIAASLEAFDVVIDFTIPTATVALAELCAEHGNAMVIGTTGFTPEQLESLDKAAQRTAIFMSPNMSVGVNVAMRLIEAAALALGDDADVEVIEAHHRHKVDAPSGTAVRMGEVLARVLNRDLSRDAIYGRQGITGERERKTIGFSTIRGGDIVGEHTVMFAGDGERLEITHRAQSRDNFAAGALRAAAFIESQRPGLYGMDDLLAS